MRILEINYQNNSMCIKKRKVERLYKIKEVADLGLIGYGSRHIQDLIKNKEIGCVRITPSNGKRGFVRLSESNIQDFLDIRSVKVEMKKTDWLSFQYDQKKRIEYLENESINKNCIIESLKEENEQLLIINEDLLSEISSLKKK